MIQTLHPVAVPPPYDDGWRREDFMGFGIESGWQPMPWYFRTPGSWFAAVSTTWWLTCIEEPLHPETRMPASLLLTAEA